MPAPSSRDAGVRLDSIDALRGIAALMVACYHVWGHYGVYPFPSLGVVPQTANAGIFAWLVSPFRWGYLGVSFFLVLSGFCIHLPYARKRRDRGTYEFRPREFYLRRMWRLYPAYAISVIATFVLLQLSARSTSYVAEGAPSLGNLLTHLTLTHGYFDRFFYGIVTVYWSLALEFQLYLAYPIFLYLFYRRGLSQSILWLTAFSLVWRYVSMSVFHHQLISVAWTGPYSLMGFLFARMPEWLFGAWLAEQYVMKGVGGRPFAASRSLLGWCAVSVLFLAILSTLIQELWVATDIVFGVGFALIVASAITPRTSSSRTERKGLLASAYRWLVWSGTISYSLYLFHMQLSWFGNFWIQKLPGNIVPFALRLLILIVSIPIIALIFRYVEAPFLKAPHSGDALYPLYSRLRRMIGIKADAVIAAQTATP